MNESRKQERLGEGLSKLPKVDKSSLLASFVKQQQRNTNLYEVEGKRYLQTWSRERVAQSSVVGSKVGKATDRERRKMTDKEGEKSRGVTGIETPVLKPRNPDASLRAAAVKKARSRTQGKENAALDERPKASKADKAKEVNNGRERENTGTSKVVAPKAKERAKSTEATEDGGSDSEDNTAVRDREQRMNARKERRREKREIVNPKKRKDLSERNSVDGSDEDMAAGTNSKEKGRKNKKQKIPAGLALMHGFSATNVGKSRLTMEPALRPTGVFSKGKASGKTATVKRSVEHSGFSELRFLNKRPAREENSPEPEVARRRSKNKPPTEKTRKKATSKKHARELSPERCPTEAPSSSSSESEEEDVQERPKRRPRSSSLTWDIEHESAQLPSTDISVEVPIARVSRPPKAKPPREEEAPVDISEHSRSHGGEKIRSSLGPQDSASQCAPRDSSSPRRRPETDTFSKYFQQILEHDTGAPSSGKELARTIPCPTFVAAAPVEPEASIPSPVDDRERSAVSNDLQDGSQISLWLAHHPDPHRQEGTSRDWQHGATYQQNMDEQWQDGPNAFRRDSTGCLNSRARHSFDERRTMVPEISPEVAVMEEHNIIDEEFQLDYWEDTQQHWGVSPEEEHDFVMDEDFAGDPRYGDFDDGNLALDYEAMPWTVYESGPFEGLDTGDCVPDFPERYGVPDSGSQQQFETEFDGSQHGEFWQDTGSDPNPSDGEHEDLVDTSEPEYTGSMQGLLFAEDGVCHFLQGRSALLGFDINVGATMPKPSYDPGERQGATKVEIDVAKGLKNHWRPQRL